MERVLSLARFSKSDLAEEKIFGNGDKPPKNRYWQEFGQNSLTYQFGDALFKGKKTKGMAPEEVLASAKEWIDTRMEYIGFFEQLPSSFWHIHTEIFGDDVSVPFMYPWFYWIGAVAFSPRRTVRKFQNRFGKVHPDVLENVARWQQMDIELYEYAKAKFNPSVHLYDSYGEFVWDHWLIFLLLFLVVLSPVVFLVFLHRKKRQRLADSPASHVPDKID